MLQRLTVGSGSAFEQNQRPLWSPDGQTVFFRSLRLNVASIFSKPADGSGPAKQVTTAPFGGMPTSITSDGKTLVFRQGSDATTPNLDVGILRLGGDGEPEMLLETSFEEHTPKLSPDDRWLAYGSMSPVERRST